MYQIEGERGYEMCERVGLSWREKGYDMEGAKGYEMEFERGYEME